MKSKREEERKKRIETRKKEALSKKKLDKTGIITRALSSNPSQLSSCIKHENKRSSSKSSAN